MAEFDYKEYARQMRENCYKNENGNIICSAELWEHIASIIESTADVVPKSEVEKWKQKAEELSEVLSDTIRIRYSEAKVEVAREIFEQIETSLHIECFHGGEVYYSIQEEDYLHYKKKYAEREG
jgi:hypothetical protein